MAAIVNDGLHAILLLVLMSWIRESECSLDEFRLIRNLTANYDSTVRPVTNATETLTVEVAIALNQIIDMDEKNQILKTMVWMRLFWYDAYFKWNPKDYGGVSSIRLMPNDVWTPDITMYNDVGDIGMTTMSQYNVIYNSDGFATWLAPVPLISACNLDISDFPYDQQTCNLTFGSWTFHGIDLDLQNRSEEGDDSGFNSNGEWFIHGIPVHRTVTYYSCCPLPYPTLTFSIIMRRRPLFYIFNLLLPCVVIIATTAMGFLLPPDSGEKVSLLITCMLSLTVFLLLVAETMPPNSATVPLIGSFFAASIILVALSTVMSVLILATHHRGTHGRRIPPTLRKFAFSWIATIVFKRKLVKDMGYDGSIAKVHDEKRNIKSNEIKVLELLENQVPMQVFDIEEKVRQLKQNNASPPDQLHLLKTIMKSVNDMRDIAKRKESDEKIAEEWQLFGIILDQLFFYVFLFVTAVMAIYIFTYTPSYDL